MNNTANTGSGKGDWLLAGGLGAFAAILFFASLADYAFPGVGAHLMAVWRNLDFVRHPEFPLLSAFARFLGGGNLIAPVSGIVATVALVRLVTAFVSARVGSDNARGLSAATIGRVAGGVAGLVFILTPAVRSAATHLEPQMFAVAWALLAFLPFIPYAKGGRATAAVPALAGILFGLGTCDSALFIVLAPFALAAVAILSVRRGGKPYAPLFLFVLLGFGSFFIGVCLFDADLVETFKMLARELKGYYAHPGWLFVFIFSTLPFLTSLFSSAKSFREKPGLVQDIFHGAMTFVAILAVATPLSPSALMAPYGVLPVLTSLYAAVLAGYLAAYWWSCRKSVVGLVSGGAFALVLVLSCGWNLFTFDGDSGKFADEIAKRVVTELGSRSWFVTDGSLDDHIRLAAADAGRKLDLICLQRDLDDDYLERLGKRVRETKVGGSKNESLALSLSLGVLPFVQDWFASDPSVKKDVAIFGAPDLWYSAGITPVPEVLFFGADEKAPADWSVWKELDAILDAPKGWGSYRSRDTSDPLERMRYSLRRHIGHVANDRGVFLQDHKRDDEAFAMYELVLNETDGIDCDNVCALFNEIEMAGAKHPKALARQRELERKLKSIVDDKNRRYVLWRLGNYYGYIRNPDIFVRLGHAWARSGRPGDALHQIRRAIDFVPTDRRTVLLNMMAALYASDLDRQQSRQLYEAVLAKNKADHDALVGLMRLELADGNSAKALEYLERAAEGAKAGRQAEIERAMVALMKNNLSEAKAILKKLTDANAKDAQAWSLLAAVTMQQADATKDEKEKAVLEKELESALLPALEKNATSEFDYYVQTTRAFLLLRKGEKKRREARDAFVAASKSRPDVGATQDLVLGLDISLDDKVDAERHAREVLRRNRKAPLANYVMGSLSLGRGKFAEAEAFLRRAVAGPKPVPLALNDLSETLRRRKAYAEAEDMARRCTKAAPKLYVAWETLGSIILERGGDLAEAEKCVTKACELSKDKSGREADIRMLITLARVQAKKGDALRARGTIRRVKARQEELSAYELREFEDFASSLH